MRVHLFARNKAWHIITYLLISSCGSCHEGISRYRNRDVHPVNGCVNDKANFTFNVFQTYNHTILVTAA
jgi:hypothetical protein